MQAQCEPCHRKTRGAKRHFNGNRIRCARRTKKLSEPLQTILAIDESLYGVDEVLAFSIVNIYGSIGFTNYGYIDKEKPGILGRLNDKSTGECHTFLDDIVGAIAAAASSQLAHSARNTE